MRLVGGFTVARGVSCRLGCCIDSREAPGKVFRLGGCLQDATDAESQAATPGESGGCVKTRALEKLNGQPPVRGTNLDPQPPVISRTQNTHWGPF